MVYWAQRGSGRANLFGWRFPCALRGFRSRTFSGAYEPRTRTPTPAPPNNRGPLNSSILAFLATVGILLLTRWFDSWPVLLGLGYLLWTLARGPFASAARWLHAFMYLSASALFFGACVMFLRWQPLWTVLSPLGISREGTGFKVAVGVLVLGWPVITLLLLLWSRRRGQVQVGTTQQVTQQDSQVATAQRSFIRAPRPSVTFSDYGGLEAEKREIRDFVQARLDSGKRNGIFLYGPPGTGKTYFAETIAGEFHIPFYRVAMSELTTKYPGDSELAIRREFANAAAQAPVVFLLDEIDSVGSRRVAIGAGDEGGARTLYNNITTQLLTLLTDYRHAPGLVIVAATNKDDNVDEALVRDGRFDLRIRVGLPDEAGRCKIFAAQLRHQSSEAFSLEEIAKMTPGASAARIESLVDRAANVAKREHRKIRIADLKRAISELPRERPSFDPVQWNDLVLDDATEQELRTLVRVLSPVEFAARNEVEVPTGALLVGPPGTGKGTVARLIATHTGRSLYEISPAHVYDGTASAAKRIQDLFAKARNNSPSMIFIDEMDGLLPCVQFGVAQHDVQIVNQFLIEISSLRQENQVFLLGATNRIGSIDPRALRGGRFSKKIEMKLPDAASTERLLARYLESVRLRPGLCVADLAGRLLGIAPADLEAICGSAKMIALSRTRQNQALAPLEESDFEQAKQSVLAVAS
jgi:transitional endoplasmic reticulum ATPase